MTMDTTDPLRAGSVTPVCTGILLDWGAATSCPSILTDTEPLMLALVMDRASNRLSLDRVIVVLAL